MNTRLSCLARSLCALGFAVLAAAAPPAFAAISVTDDAGATVTLQRPAQRIVSLAPHVTELLFAAGGGARIVGTVAYSDYPPPARDIPHVGDNRSLDLERIAALKPDLVVVWRHGNAQKQIDRLRALGIPLFFSEPHRMSDIPRSIETLGTLLDTRASAHDAAQQFRQRVDMLRNRYASRPPVTVFYQVWEQPLMTLNGQHIFSDMLALCGGRNVFASEPLLQLYDHVRGLTSWPGSYGMLAGKRIKFFRTRKREEACSEAPGTVLGFQNHAMQIACRGGVLEVYELQPEGKGRMDADSFHNGLGRSEIGKVFD